MDHNGINFQDQNHQSDDERNSWSHTQWVDEFYRFLQGESLEGMAVGKHGLALPLMYPEFVMS